MSVWSPTWLDGTAVGRVAEWYLGRGAGWRVTEVSAVEATRLETQIDAVRASPYIESFATGDCPTGKTPVAFELSRLERGRTGPMEELVIEFASSTIPCALGLHSVDVRRPLPDDAFEKRHRDRTARLAREVLEELKTLAATLPVAWGVVWTFGRGPSIAELVQDRGAPSRLGCLYVSHQVSTAEIAAISQSEGAVDIGPGHVVAWTKLFGGSQDALTSATLAGTWKVLRKASTAGLPWETLRAMKMG